MPPIEPESSDDLRTCEWCGGKFLSEDMDGEHCRTCAEDIFSDMGLPL
jgi:hypothetical protein